MRSFVTAMFMVFTATGCAQKATFGPTTGAAALRQPAVSITHPEPPPYDDEQVPVEAWELAPAVAVTKLTPTTGACVPDLLDGAPFWGPIGSEHSVELCRVDDFETRAATCFTLDVTSGVVTATPPSKAVLATLTGRATRTQGSVKLSEDGKAAESCVGPCVPLDLEGMTAANVGVVGAFAFAAPAFDGDLDLYVDGEISKTLAVRVFDARTGALQTLIGLSGFDSACPGISATGDVLYGEFGVCAGPGATGYFLDPKSGALLHPLGGAARSAPAWGVYPVALGGGRFAFRDQSGMAVYVHSGTDGRLLSSLNLTPALHPADPELGFGTSAEEGGMVRLGDGRLVVTHGDRHRDRVIVLNSDATAMTQLFTLRGCDSVPGD